MYVQEDAPERGQLPSYEHPTKNPFGCDVCETEIDKGFARGRFNTPHKGRHKAARQPPFADVVLR